MEKHLFLTGKAGCGKSALIKSVLGEKLAYAGGYMTVGKHTDDGSIARVELMPAPAAAGIAGYESECILTRAGNALFHDNEVFRNTGVRLMQEAQYYPFAVLDEFGGFELIIPQFREALLEVLNSELPCVGVLTEDGEGEALRHALGLGEKYTAYRRALKNALLQDKDTRIVEIRHAGDIDAAKAVAAWAAEYAV